MNKYAKFILEKNIFLIEYSPIYVREYMKSKTGEFLYGIPTEKIALDDTDKKILKQLSTNSRISIVDLVKNIKLTRDIIVYRMKKLTEQKILVHYRCYPNYEAINTYISKIVIYTKNFDSKAEMQLKEYVREHKNSWQLLKLIGSWDIEIEFETKDEDELYAILTDIRKQFSRIIRDYDIIKVKKTHKYNFYPFEN